MSLTAAVNHSVKNWKTTAGAVMTVLLTLSGIMTASPTWAGDYGLTRYEALWITLAIAGIKLAIGAIQTDGTQVDVSLPANTPVQVNLPPGAKLEQDTTIVTPK